MPSKVLPPASSFIIRLSLLFVALIVAPLAVHMQLDESGSADSSTTNGNLMRKSIVFDLKTPKVFYCPQEKPSDSDKMIVKARPLDRLCEFQGQAKPKNAPSDCYDDLDETGFACDEKKRFMIRLDLAGEIGDLVTDYGLDPEYVLSKGPGKKKVTPNGKKF